MVSSRLLSRLSLVSFLLLASSGTFALPLAKTFTLPFFYTALPQATYLEVVVESLNPCRRGVGFIRTVLKR